MRGTKHDANYVILSSLLLLPACSWTLSVPDPSLIWEKFSHLCKTQSKFSPIHFNICALIENRNTSRLNGIQHCPVLVPSCFLHACKYLQNAEYLIHSWSVTLKSTWSSTILSTTYRVSFHRRMLGKILYVGDRSDLPWSPLLCLGISLVYSFHCWGNSSLSQKN